MKAAQGVKLGRPWTIDAEVSTMIETHRAAGKSLRAIADELNSQNVPTGQGGAKWHASTVKAILDRANVEQAA